MNGRAAPDDSAQDWDSVGQQLLRSAFIASIEVGRIDLDGKTAKQVIIEFAKYFRGNLSADADDHDGITRLLTTGAIFSTRLQRFLKAVDRNLLSCSGQPG